MYTHTYLHAGVRDIRWADNISNSISEPGRPSIQCPSMPESSGLNLQEGYVFFSRRPGTLKAHPGIRHRGGYSGRGVQWMGVVL